MTTQVALLAHYDGVACELLAMRCGASQLVAVAQCSSTMDLAHQLAVDGAPHGTIVVAEEQGAGRGRAGKSWRSGRGAGVWASVVLRDGILSSSGVLSLRVGLALAHALDHAAGASVQLKWPNDLYVGSRKLAGVLAEARWRGDLLEWIVVGVGVNVRALAGDAEAASLTDDARCADVLVDVVRAVLSAAEGTTALTSEELAEFERRDLARGREVTSPLVGTVQGITASGGVRIRSGSGDAVAVAGSLTFASPRPE